VKPVLDAVLEKHSPIAGRFFDPSLGVKLQHLDASIAEQVILTFVKRGIPILPIHDSFIVPQEQDDLLQTTMREVFERRIGVTPTVKNLLLGWQAMPSALPRVLRNTRPIIYWQGLRVFFLLH
jgi:hypothetical protein